jgi:hypothetical protein
MSTETRFNTKRLQDAATALQLDTLDVFERMDVIKPESPLWPLAVAVQREFCKIEHRENHTNYKVTVANDDDSVAVLWNSQVRPDAIGQCFLSIQATTRETPRATKVGDSKLLNEFLAMIEDINSNNTGASTILIRKAVELIRDGDFLLVHLDGDPETNQYLLQAYTKDRKYLIDVQVYYDVIQDDITHQEKINKI